MSDEFTIDNDPGGYKHVEVHPATVIFLLFGMVQHLHDAFASLVEDLSERGVIDSSEYLLPEPVVFDLGGEDPQAA